MRPRRFRWLGVLAAAAVLVLLMAVAHGGPARAASPAAGTIGPTGPSQTWVGTAAGGTSAGEDSCVEGVNCDTYILNVASGDWAGKVVDVKITWAIPTNDFDLYIHRCPAGSSTPDACNAGPLVATSGDGAPDTDEEAAIDPAAGTGTFSVHVVYFSVVGEQYTGTASVQPKPVARTAAYVSGGMTFSPSVTVKAPVAARDGEPSSRTDNLGNFYVAGIRGVPAGVDLWYDALPNDPYMRNWVYRGQPDSFTCDNPDPEACVGADGGGDVDLAVGRPNPGTGAVNNPPTLAFSSLVASNVSVGRSTDKGVTFQRNPLGNVPGGAPIDDRQWQEFYGKDSAYLFYRTIAPALSQIQRSADGGLTYGPAQTAGFIGQAGYIDVHQATGTVYVSGSSGAVCHSTTTLPTGDAATYKCKTAAADPAGVGHLFFVVKVADDGTANGTVYVAYSNDRDIFLAHSTDGGETWSQPVRVSNGPETTTSVFPWLETGPTPGSVGVVWYGTTASANDDTADWNVFYAQTYNATDASPTFRQVKVSDHVIHAGNISEGGLTGTANRNLLDYFQLSYDPNGAAVIGYTDDHNDFDGHTYVTHQIGGPGLNAAKANVPAPGAPPAPESGPIPHAADVGGEPGSQVTDFRHDVSDALLVVTPTDDPLDILSVNYSCEGSGAATTLVARMKVSDLSTLPAAANWRMSFTANAPNSTLSPTGDYSFGVSDRGDQFFVRASTDPTAPSGQFAFGTAVRTSSGALSYTTRGAADAGSFDQVNKTITVKVALSKLNPFVSHGPAVSPGSVLVGLRGQTFTSNVNAKRDLSRGGTQYTIGCAAADVSVAKTDAPDPVHVGQPLTYKVTVTNNGPQAATGVTVTDQLPKNAGFGSAQTTQGTCTLKPEKRTVTCNIGGLAPGSFAVVTIVVKPTQKGTITNTATVTSASPPDPNQSNNSASTTTSVVP
jgi:uncharacterized repeat protein (TIGR01451 family)